MPLTVRFDLSAIRSGETNVSSPPVATITFPSVDPLRVVVLPERTVSSPVKEFSPPRTMSPGPVVRLPEPLIRPLKSIPPLSIRLYVSRSTNPVSDPSKLLIVSFPPSLSVPSLIKVVLSLKSSAPVVVSVAPLATVIISVSNGPEIVSLPCLI